MGIYNDQQKIKGELRSWIRIQQISGFLLVKDEVCVDVFLYTK
jgi:hypothetical protein